jgi:putative transposase
MKQLYKAYGHAKTNLKYHVIFSTKYRRECLTDIRKYVLKSFKYCERISDFSILSMEIDRNHIHFLIEFKPSLSIDQVIKRLKQVSTNYLYRCCEQHLRKYYWNEKLLWTRGYFVSTIGEVSEKTLINYIRNQG